MKKNIWAIREDTAEPLIIDRAELNSKEEHRLNVKPSDLHIDPEKSPKFSLEKSASFEAGEPDSDNEESGNSSVDPCYDDDGDDDLKMALQLR